MIPSIILVAETGSDIPRHLAQCYGIHLIPMHVTFGDVTRADNTFSPEEISPTTTVLELCPEPGPPPWRTSRQFSRPSMPNTPKHTSSIWRIPQRPAVPFSGGRWLPRGRTTSPVWTLSRSSAGQCLVVLQVAKALQDHPEWTPAQAVPAAKEIIQRTRMCLCHPQPGFPPGAEGGRTTPPSCAVTCCESTPVSRWTTAISGPQGNTRAAWSE